MKNHDNAPFTIKSQALVSKCVVNEQYKNDCQNIKASFEQFGFIIVTDVNHDLKFALEKKGKQDKHFFETSIQYKKRIPEYTKVSNFKEKIDFSLSITKDNADRNHSDGDDDDMANSVTAFREMYELGTLVLDSIGYCTETNIRRVTDNLPFTTTPTSILTSFKYHRYQRKDDLKDAGAPSHIDKGLITIVFCDVKSGLMIKQPKSEEWIDASLYLSRRRAKNSSCIVFLGATLHEFLMKNSTSTDHNISCVEHQVKPPVTERYSIVFRMLGAEDAWLDDSKRTVGQFIEEWNRTHTSINQKSTKSNDLSQNNTEINKSRNAEESGIFSLMNSPSCEFNVLTERKRFRSDSEKVLLQVKNVDGELLNFSFKKTTRITSLKAKVCQQLGYACNDVRLLFDRDRIMRYDTVKEAELEDGDVINVYPQQYGD
eukprot:Pgem_evm1s18452